VTLKGKGKATKKEMTHHDIKGICIKFHPGAEFTNRVKTSDFEKVE
jgi:hypothetical protein